MIKSGERRFKIDVGGVEIQLLHTPGHTPGSQCFLVDNRIVSGDTLFIGSCGRVDLPGSNPEQMYYSLTQKLMALPDETILFPGHNYAPTKPTLTIGSRKKSNPYLKFSFVETVPERDGLSLTGVEGAGFELKKARGKNSPRAFTCWQKFFANSVRELCRRIYWSKAHPLYWKGLWQYP